MTITLKDNPVEEAEAIRDLLKTFRHGMKLLRGRPHVTACQLKAVGTLMEVLDDVEAQLPSPVAQPDSAVALTVAGGLA